uniref:Putative GDP-mannose 4,6-dehydratase n=1 Tax=viral metagenome TaxID=1070528 RepID=A0A6M3L2T8_9ZZZZ
MKGEEKENQVNKILITGITGFAGSHLADYCLNEKDQVFGTCRWRSDLKNIRHILDKITLIETDIRDAVSVRKAVAQVNPDIVFHLAAQSFVPTSWHAPEETLTTNILGTLNILEAVKDFNKDIKVLVAGSSEEYGLVHQEEIPIRETNPLKPLSPYGVSKVGQDLLTYQYFKSYNLNVVRTRAFNHCGARRPTAFVISGLVNSFVNAYFDRDKGKLYRIKHGNLDAIRDFTHVKDTVKAYYLLGINCHLPTIKGEVFNICTGMGYSIKEILNKIIREFDIAYGLQEGRHYVLEPNSKHMRPSDVPILIGDYSKLLGISNWCPTESVDFIIRDLIKYHFERRQNNDD